MARFSDLWWNQVTRKRHTLPIHQSKLGTRSGMSKRRSTTRFRETHDVSLREGSTDDAFSVACVCSISLEKAPLLEKVMLWPLQEAQCTFVVNTLRELHRKNFSSAPHFSPFENVDPRRQVTKLISPKIPSSAPLN